MVERLKSVWRSLGCSTVTEGDGVFVAIFPLDARPPAAEHGIGQFKTALWNALDWITRGAIRKKGITAQLTKDDNGWYYEVVVASNPEGLAAIR